MHTQLCGKDLAKVSDLQAVAQVGRHQPVALAIDG